MTDTAQLVAPPRSSTTEIVPSGPEMTSELVLANWVPSETLAMGAEIERAPPVMSKLAGVAADAGAVTNAVALAAASAPTSMTPR